MQLEMNANFFEPKESILIKGFFATPNLPVKKNNNYKRAGKSVLLYLVMKKLVYALNIRMCAEERLSLFVVYVRNKKNHANYYDSRQR